MAFTFWQTDPGKVQADVAAKAARLSATRSTRTRQATMREAQRQANARNAKNGR